MASRDTGVTSLERNESIQVIPFWSFFVDVAVFHSPKLAKDAPINFSAHRTLQFTIEQARVRVIYM
jgi:hypothetical protein